MSFRKMKIANCRRASIRKAPWRSYDAHDIIDTKKRGEEVEVNTSEICYSWTDERYFRTRNPRGWIRDGVLDFTEGGRNGYGDSD